MSFTSYFFENLLVLLSRTFFFNFVIQNLLKIHVPRIRGIELHILLVISEYDRLHQIYQFVIKRNLRTFCVVMINVHFRHCRTLRKLLDLKQIFPSTNSVMFCQKYSTSKCENVTWKITTEKIF